MCFKTCFLARNLMFNTFLHDLTFQYSLKSGICVSRSPAPALNLYFPAPGPNLYLPVPAFNFYQSSYLICVCLFFVLQLKFVIVTVTTQRLLTCSCFLGVMWEIIKGTLMQIWKSNKIFVFT